MPLKSPLLSKKPLGVKPMVAAPKPPRAPRKQSLEVTHPQSHRAFEKL